MNILDCRVSYYHSIGDTVGRTVNLHETLTRQPPELVRLIEDVRAAKNEEEKNMRKKGLPLFAPSALLNSRDSDLPLDQKLVSYTGLMQFDIDEKQNPGMNAIEVRDALAKIPFVAYVGLSVSGKGVWGMVRVERPERLEEHYSQFRAIIESRTSIRLDSSKGSNPTGLRYVSVDTHGKYNLNPLVLSLREKRAIKPKPVVYPTGSDSLTDVDLLVRAVVEQRLDLLSDYGTWFAVGSAFARELGENGRELFHAVSQFSPKYDYHRTEKDYSHWMRYPNNKGQIGAFFNACKVYGLYLKDIKVTRRLNVSSKSEERPKPPLAVVYVPPLPKPTESHQMGYNPTMIADLLTAPHHYTAREAVSIIANRIQEPNWYSALLDYHRAMLHPEPEIVSLAYLKDINTINYMTN